MIQQASKGIDSSHCQEGGDHEFIMCHNDRMDFKLEIVPICVKCKRFFRDEKLGWKILEDIDEKDE